MKKHFLRKALQIGIFGLMLLGTLGLAKVDTLADNVVIVIDPGHGGENEGGKTEVYTEKEITLRTAIAMKEELEKYQGVQVYLTHDVDKDMEIKDRVAYAESVHADFYYSLHYNMSEYHTLYGTECWISAFGDCHAKGYDCAKIVNEELASTGIANRGIKMRLGKKGTDYYGVIRYAAEYDMPAMIIEHCHMDHEKDAPYLNLESWPEKYGVMDATAVAKYFHLKSDKLGVDYSSFQYEKTKAVKEVLGPDKTGPEELSILSLERDEEKGVLHASISAVESYSKLMYYCYSMDGGVTFSDREIWPDGEASVNFDIPIPVGMDGKLILRVYNNYDLETDSEEQMIAGLPFPEEISTMDEDALGEMKDDYEARSLAERVFAEQMLAAKVGSVVCCFMTGMAFLLMVASIAAIKKKVLSGKIGTLLLLASILALGVLGYFAFDHIRTLQCLLEVAELTGL